jgi:hypothetical protein
MWRGLLIYGGDVQGVTNRSCFWCARTLWSRKLRGRGRPETAYGWERGLAERAIPDGRKSAGRDWRRIMTRHRCRRSCSDSSSRQSTLSPLSLSSFFSRYGSYSSLVMIFLSESSFLLSLPPHSIHVTIRQCPIYLCHNCPLFKMNTIY